MELRVPLTRPQLQFLSSTATHRLFVGGVGSGKTFVGAWYAALELAKGGVGFIGANTERQLARVVVPPVLGNLEALRLPYVYGKAPPAAWGRSRFTRHDSVLSVLAGGGLSQAVCGQLTNYDVHRGIEIRWMWLDETRDTKEEAFDVLLGRRRGFGDGPYPVAVTTTPNGFNWLYERFISDGDRALRSRHVVAASTFTNRFLPKAYADGLLKAYSATLARQEVYGEFITLASGRAYAEFSRADHVDASIEYDPRLPLVHSWDFNVNPLCSIIAQPVGRKCVNVVDEIHIEGSARTLDAAEEFVRRYGHHRGEVLVYGDYAGNARSTRGDGTDFDIIASAYRPVFGPRLRMCNTYAAPPVFESVQAVNAMLRNAAGEVRLKIHPRCAFTIRDLEQVSFTPGTRAIDKADSGLTHHADALRYYIAAEWPVGGERLAPWTPRAG